VTDPAAAPLAQGVREVDPHDAAALRALARLHVQLLDFGPLAALGERFVSQVCYRMPMLDGLLRAALYYVDGVPVGLVGYTCRSATFHARALRNHWIRAGGLVLGALLADPRRVRRLGRAVRVTVGRGGEKSAQADPSAEVLSIGVLPAYLTPAFVARTGRRISEELLEHAAAYFARAGVPSMRMFVDADNRRTLLFYHRMGAEFQPRQQAGESVVEVRFDLTERSARTAPAVWSVAPSPPDGAANVWAGYWERLQERQTMFRIEAEDVARRLQRAVALGPRTRMLDFGCGFGLVANHLAGRVAELALWDGSANIRRWARVNVAAHPNVRFLDLSGPPPPAEFDVILVHSVAQYFSVPELQRWLATWRAMLAPGGCLIVSDLVPPGYDGMKDLFAFVGFSARKRFLLRAFWEGLSEARHYGRTRAQQDLLRVDPEHLRRWSAEQGLDMALLPENISYRRRRLAAVLRDSRTPRPA
jgi:cyclopropane fatty-acyl-phospholipid synthase-like methyltransferase/ribosomal protein S18 acetylase RimI-like enzyme